MPPPLHRMSATEVLNLLKDEKINVVTYARDLLDRINKRDSIVKAWTYLDSGFVLNQAKALDQIPRGKRGPLHGLAVGVKDVVNTKDMPTQMGSPLYKGHQSYYDASIVGILRAAGALIFGKTTTTEFCAANSGPNTTNPHDPERTPGGSSCGSAAAVADFHVPIAVGAQTGGSIIRPASFTGVFALKPTYNAISPEGTKVCSSTFDTLGFLTRSIADLQLLADVFALEDDEPVQEIPLEKATVAIVKTPNWESAGPGTIAAMERAEELLKNSGVEVHVVSFPAPLNDRDRLKHISKVIVCSEARRSFLREYRVNKGVLGPDIRSLVENKANFTNQDMSTALDTLASMRPIIDKMAREYSVILAPSAADEAPVGLEDMGSPAFNTFWTGFHVPVLNVPAFTGAHGMPISVSLVAGRFRDQHLLRIGQVLSDALMAESD
ncbi:amidase signature enzyme [Melanomma pulvis-pyrius CBS 109.77]|uniref:Amidase signature enzyme n=1 Tax=Melanomma pulvis-pyrius CBS 109.77 TaxID=1314802 RepID=A0A6A6WQB0_9PLEO|nr:amidase signature enzyme [Melanomma pulvis-pyrius CBS 109.77]